MKKTFILKRTTTKDQTVAGITCMPDMDAFLMKSAEKLAQLDCENMPLLMKFLRAMQESKATSAPFVAQNITDFVTWYSSKALSPFQPEFLSSDILAEHIVRMSMFSDGFFRFTGCFNESLSKCMDEILDYIDDVIEIYAECYNRTVKMEAALAQQIAAKANTCNGNCSCHDNK